MSIRRYFKVSCWIIGLFILYFFIFNILYDNINTWSQIDFYNQQPNTLDVIFIGTSQIYSGYNNPMAFHEYGISSYNFSTGSMPFAAVKYLIREVEKRQKPSLYVIDLRDVVETTTDSGSILRVTAFMPWSKNKIEVAKNILDIYNISQSSLWDYLFIYPFFHSRWKELLNNYESSINNGNEINIPIISKYENEKKNIISHKGYLNYWYDINGWQSKISDYNNYYTKEILSLPKQQQQVLVDLCEFCLGLQAKVLFINSPSVHYPELYAKINDAVQIVNSYGFDYFDGIRSNVELGIVPEDWFDGGHLNAYGSDKFTRFLSEFILDNYQLSDHRNDPLYNTWEEEYNEILLERITDTNLLCHILKDVYEQNLNAVFSFFNVLNFSDEEIKILNTMGIDTFSENFSGIFNIQNGAYSSMAFSEYNSQNSFSDNNIQVDSDNNFPCVFCSVIDPHTHAILRQDVFYFDPERELFDSNYSPVNKFQRELLSNALESIWYDHSLLEEISSPSDYIISDFSLHNLEKDIYADCVFALVNTDCSGQTIYAEFQNQNGIFRTFKLDTVEREDWAKLLNNEKYKYGGAGLHIPYEELPDEEYKVRLYREKYDSIFYYDYVWSVAVKHPENTLSLD